MSHAPRTAVLLMSAAIAACGLLTGCTANPATQQGASEPAATDVQSQPGIETHGSLGTFEALALDGGSFTQEDLAEADVTVFNFWSTTCGPCINEMPDIAALAETLPDTVQIVNVCLDGHYNAERAQTVLDEAGFDGVTLVGGTDGFLELCLSVQYTPTKVLVGSDGTVLGNAIVGGGQTAEQALEEAIDAALVWSDSKDAS